MAAANLNPRVYMDITVGERQVGRMEFELFADEVPRTAENFRCLCTGEKGQSLISGVELSYKKSTFHRIINGFMAQGGDFTQHNGTGGESIYGKKFVDENFKRKHTARGLLSMANAGPNTNGSQFFITFGATPHLNGKHVVFGQLAKGSDVLRILERVSVGVSDRPRVTVRIADCGQLGDESVADAPEGADAKDAEAGAAAAAAAPDGPEKRTAERATFLYTAVRTAVDKHTRKRDGEAKYVAKATEGMDFPVPTLANPDATWVDDEARRKAQAKLDAKKKEEEFEQALAAEADPRKRRLMQLRARMAKGRGANHSEVLQEHARHSDPGFERKRRKAEYEAEAKERLDAIKAAGGSEETMYHFETAEQSQQQQAKKRRKAKNTAAFGWSVFNKETLYKAYDKRLASLPTSANSEQAHADLSAVAVDFGADDEVSEAALDRMVKEIKGREEKRAKFSRRRGFNPADDITHINERNAFFNKKLARTYDKYTAKIKADLERGTAL